MSYRKACLFVFVFMIFYPSILSKKLSNAYKKNLDSIYANYAGDPLTEDVNDLKDFVSSYFYLFGSPHPQEQRRVTPISNPMEHHFEMLTNKIEQYVYKRLKAMENDISNNFAKILNTKLNSVAVFLENRINQNVSNTIRKEFLNLSKRVLDLKVSSSETSTRKGIPEDNQLAFETLYAGINQKFNTMNENFLMALQDQRKWLQEHMPNQSNSVNKTLESCAEIFEYERKSADDIYMLEVTGLPQFYAYCMNDPIDENATAWTVIQRRVNGEKSFEKLWNDYKHGFGDLKNDHWLGLERLHALTSSQNYELLIELEDWNGIKNYAKYDKFRIGSEEEKYPLSVLGAYNGTFDDSLTYHAGQKFSTIDADNDERINGNCAEEFKGGWWYADCHVSNLNGVYNSTEYGVGINWKGWHGYNYSLKYTLMAIRPRKL